MSATSYRYATACPVAVFDLDKLIGGITVTFAAGSESFDAIGASGPW
jgi:DNA/RNA-binding domain of Phe-tRNA-synthetase-like protein